MIAQEQVSLQYIKAQLRRILDLDDKVPIFSDTSLSQLEDDPIYIADFFHEMGITMYNFYSAASEKFTSEGRTALTRLIKNKRAIRDYFGAKHFRALANAPTLKNLLEITTVNDVIEIINDYANKPHSL